MGGTRKNFPTQGGHEEAGNDPAFRKAKDERAAAYRAQPDYLIANDKKLAELKPLFEDAGAK